MLKHCVPAWSREGLPCPHGEKADNEAVATPHLELCGKSVLRFSTGSSSTVLFLQCLNQLGRTEPKLEAGTANLERKELQVHAR